MFPPRPEQSKYHRSTQFTVAANNPTYIFKTLFSIAHDKTGTAPTISRSKWAFNYTEKTSKATAELRIELH